LDLDRPRVKVSEAALSSVELFFFVEKHKQLTPSIGAATSLLLGSIGILALVNLGNGLVSLVARDEAKTNREVAAPSCNALTTGISFAMTFRSPFSFST
jgi:hypothetical protein